MDKEGLFNQVAEVISRRLSIPLDKITKDTLIGDSWINIVTYVTFAVGKPLLIHDGRNLTVGKLLEMIEES